MLTITQIQDRLKQYTYRPGWAIEASEGVTEGQKIRIVAELEDSENIGQKVIVKVNSPLPYCITLADLDRWMSWRLKRIEAHESCEWFKINGECFINPHADGADNDTPF